MAPLAGILAELVTAKRAAVAGRSRALPRAELEARARSLPAPRSLGTALARPPGAAVRILAELKRASPVAGILARGFDPVARAAEYVRAGAAGLSVLTDPHFQGTLDDLETVRAQVDCPVLQKDFVIDPYQLWEARARGADAVLLIAAVLDGPRLAELYQAAAAIGLSVLVEVHDEAELDRVVALGARLVGVNNRDLSRFVTDLGTTERLAPRVPPGTCLVSESGIRTAADVERVGRAGAHAVLVGEALSRSGDPAAKIRELGGAPSGAVAR